jgi:uncharacterized membrane protein YdjX (TVP38/TMEM64 family)
MNSDIPAEEKAKPKTSWKIQVARICAIIFVIALTVFLYLNRSKVQQLGALGYPGIFLVSILANATIILPVPGILITSAMGAIFNPFWVAVAAGTGAALGELTGYLAGFSGQGIIENRKWYVRFERWMKKYGDITIFVLAIIPNPLFDVAGMTAGALKMPLWRYLIWVTLGKIIKMMIFAYFGAYISSLVPWAIS